MSFDKANDEQWGICNWYNGDDGDGREAACKQSPESNEVFKYCCFSLYDS